MISEIERVRSGVLYTLAREPPEILIHVILRIDDSLYLKSDNSLRLYCTPFVMSQFVLKSDIADFSDQRRQASIPSPLYVLMEMCLLFLATVNTVNPLRQASGLYSDAVRIPFVHIISAIFCLFSYDLS